MWHSSREGRKLQVPLISVFAIIALLCVGLALYRRFRHQTDDVRSTYAMTRTSVVMGHLYRYGQSHGHFPGDSFAHAEGNSWRFQLAPYLESDDYSDLDFAASWRSARNARMAEFAHPDYCFTDFVPQLHGSATNVMALVGPGTFFTEASLGRVDLEPDAMVLVETRQSAIHWMQPGDIDIKRTPQVVGRVTGISGVIRGRIHVAFVDKEVWCLRSDVPFAELAKFVTVESAKRFTRENVLTPYRIDRFRRDPVGFYELAAKDSAK